MRRLLIILFILSLLALPVAAQDAPPTIADTIITAAGQEPQFTMLLALLQSADPMLLETLDDPTAELTVFAPTDAAFETWMEARSDTDLITLLRDPEAVTALLAYHVLDSVVEVEPPLLGPTVQGQYLDVVVDEATIWVDRAQVIETISTPANGVIHVIDNVLIPETRTVWQLLVDASHPETAALRPVADPVNRDFVAMVPELTVLFAALEEADPALIALLDDPEATVTLFAPLDAATVDEAALQYHIVPGLVDYGAMLDAEAGFVTMDGRSVEVTGTTINGTEISIPQIDAANGVIHILPSVLTPE